MKNNIKNKILLIKNRNVFKKIQVVLGKAISQKDVLKQINVTIL